MDTRFPLLLLFVAVFLGLVVSVSHSRAAQPLSASLAAHPLDHHALQIANDWEHKFRVSSMLFENDGQIPPSMVFNGQLGSTCTGTNTSPDLEWKHGPWNTRSYVVTLFDVSANYAHWGQYNIPADTTMLSAGAGGAGNGPGLQVYNDAFNLGYTGPCPPPGSESNTDGIHHYVFTVYALDTKLDLIPAPAFPPYADGLYRGMINHVIDQASVTGLFNCNDDSTACN
jgi:Raf kinase inhibitor-like YbhB/YbcL family protein